MDLVIMDDYSLLQLFLTFCMIMRWQDFDHFGQNVQSCYMYEPVKFTCHIGKVLAAVSSFNLWNQI